MSLEAHHRFILDTMQRNQDIARNIINELEAENARLKAEVERLRASSFVTAVPVEEYEKLKAEVERLKAQFARLESVDENELGLTVPRRLVLFWMYRAKRLHKAGDAMSEVIQTIDHERFECYPQYRMTTKERNACDAWNAAKEGKQP